MINEITEKYIKLFAKEYDKKKDFESFKLLFAKYRNELIEYTCKCYSGTSATIDKKIKKEISQDNSTEED